jgi:hypothetical protein
MIILLTLTRGLYGVYIQSLDQIANDKARQLNCVPLLQKRQNFLVCLKYGMLLLQCCVEGFVVLMQSQQNISS